MKPRLSTWLFSILALCLSFATAEDMLISTSLKSCQANDDSFSASLFDVAFTPNNRTLTFDIVGESTVTGYVTIELVIYAYGYKAYTKYINPCESNLQGLCPMQVAPVVVNSNAQIDQDALSKIPGIAYTVPDLDAKVQAYFIKNDTGVSLACVEAELSNGKTVDQTAVAWVTAVISGLGLAASAITSGLGHSNTAAHVAANALALFGYFQAQAFIGLTAVPLPPVVASWTQNFQWSMGIINVGFVQTIATWYQRATGGTPSTVFSTLLTKSVQVTKRGLESDIVQRALQSLHEAGLRKRTTVATVNNAGGNYIVAGIERVGFRAGIELSNIFMTGYIFFLAFVILVVIGVLAFKGACEILTRMGHMRGDKFKDFRNGWNTVLKGILFRIILIGFPQMVVLCFWEFTMNDSGAEVTLAVFTVFAMMFILAWAASKVIRLARRSIAMHKNPAYILYSDPTALNKWGFLYVQFKAAAYYFITIILAYLFVKGIFIGLAQASGAAQAIAFVIIEAAFLITVCVLRPYMDKKTNAFNIAISAINFINALFILIFSNIFNQPALVTGVMGVVFFVYNAAFSTILLIIVLVASIIAIVAKNPDTRYQPMRDDRSSFIKSQTQLTTELDALGATARGEGNHGVGNTYTTEKSGARIEDDEDSWSGGSSKERNNSDYYAPHRENTRSPVNGSTAYLGAGADSMTGRHNPPYISRQQTASPYSDHYSRTGSMNSQTQQYRSHGGAAGGGSNWNRGAGYD
ncbi:hypothetical protein AMS68_005716 [Peltaster fructicola]|uniref:ML-like domain-containing protein n=1 Tax=Peltaster fructicola TaxID=286661 RepID=A0A6H0Y008_9PEZI|nr:hypothetical protein AMS68_005716 [Peltaster fructicola]